MGIGAAMGVLGEFTISPVLNHLGGRGLTATAKAVDLCQDRGLQHFLIGGGVAANSRLRGLLEERMNAAGIELRRPRPGLCTDNGAMMAVLGSEVVKAGGRPSSMDIGANSGLPISTILV